MHSLSVKSALKLSIGFAVMRLLLSPLPAHQNGARSLSADEVVRIALGQSPSVEVAKHRFEAAEADLRGARAAFHPQVELAPGAGFTNGNAALSQRLDIGGLRAAESRAAAGERAAAAAELEQARLQAASEVLTAYFDLVRAQASETAAAEFADLARQIRTAVKHRVELGESPEVQAIRAEIEVDRADQAVARARGDVKASLSTLNLLLGRPFDMPATLSDTLVVPTAPGPVTELIQQAMLKRPDLAVMRGLLQVRQGEVAIARARRRPELFTELAADVWSLDRDPFQHRNIGFQARLSFPLFDLGKLGSEEASARASVYEQEAASKAAARTAAQEIARAAAELAALREAALNYQQKILPRTQELLHSTRSGYEIGLTSFVEVLEAQRTARQVQTETLNTLFDAARVRIALDRAMGIIPGRHPIQTTSERR